MKRVSYPDTFFSAPAVCAAFGKSVSGLLYIDRTESVPLPTFQPTNGNADTFARRTANGILSARDRFRAAQVRAADCGTGIDESAGHYARRVIVRGWKSAECVSVVPAVTESDFREAYGIRRQTDPLAKRAEALAHYRAQRGSLIESGHSSHAIVLALALSFSMDCESESHPYRAYRTASAFLGDSSRVDRSMGRASAAEA
jgi:hypothetical protein